ncbi:MAG: peptidoglycan DD-metalloendopeptidase family protein [Patescibacteria group bacterium]|nr:peptidoglycan DD-metalloendopeptidase family protein [Patescibacteria group bacterium]
MSRTKFIVALFWAALISAKGWASEPLLYMPFKMGTYWWCPQAAGGGFSHTGKLYHSYDFNKIKSQSNSSDPAYGQPVYSPLRGTVKQVVNNIPDFQYNNVSNANNNYGWGNTVLIEDEATGKCLRICHFKQWSIAVQQGQKIDAVKYLGQIGMTGWSTNPHLHMHLQQNCSTSTSVPFSFVEGSVTDDGSWNTYKCSELSYRTSVIDEDGSTNLGNYLANSYVTKSGSWQSGTLFTGFVGEGYLAAQSSSWSKPKFTWHFNVQNTGFYVIFAKWTHHENRDHKAKYTVVGTVAYRDQRQYGSYGYTYIGWKFLTPGDTYEVSVEGTTPGRYVVADAIVLLKL